MLLRRKSYSSESMKPGYDMTKISYFVTKENLAIYVMRAYILDDASVDSGVQVIVTGKFR